MVRRSTRSIFGIPGAIFGILFGIAFIVMSQFIGNALRGDESLRATAEGSIVRVIEKPPKDRRSNVTYTPVVEFRVGESEPIQFTDSTSYGGVAAPKVGDRVTVSYLKSNPQDARMETFFTRYFHWIFAVAGALIAITSAFALLRGLVRLGLLGGVLAVLLGRKH
jgi:hypothetical protein